MAIKVKPAKISEILVYSNVFLSPKTIPNCIKLANPIANMAYP